jgi:hypothetical protein
MRLSVRRLLFLFASMAALLLPAPADEFVVGEIRGSGSTTTGLFKVHDKWEVRWNARQVISVAVMASDGTIVAGAAGVLRGSLFIPLGGKYYFKISDGTNGMLVAPRVTSIEPNPDTPVEPVFAWHLQVVELGSSVTDQQALTVYTPYFMVPDAAVTPSPTPAPPPEPPPPAITDAQAHAIVVVKGDNLQGYGFLVKSPDGTFVATHLSLLVNNPNVQIYTDRGVVIPTLSVKAATDRDLALFAIKDDHFSYLTQATDPSTDVAVGDKIFVPNANQSPPALSPGKVLALTPDRIEYGDLTAGNGSVMSPFGAIAPDAATGTDSASNTLNIGMPVIDAKSGKALGLLTAEKRVDLTDGVAKAWTSNPVPGAAGIAPFYGLRLTGVTKWEEIDLSRFLAETQLLKQFHLNTRARDSYLNGRKFHIEDGPPDNKFYLGNSTLLDASNTYKQFATGADRNQRLEAAQELCSDLLSMADADLPTVQTSALYNCNQQRALEELAYRKALRAEIEDLSSNIPRLDNIARSR